MDGIKRTEEGAKAYAARDAFKFLQLAMETHDFVLAQISRVYSSPVSTRKPGESGSAYAS